MAAADVVLVQMPWAHPGRPSIPLGVIKPALEGAGLAVSCRYLNLDFFEYVLAGVDSLRCDTLLEALPQFGKSGVSAWTFMVAPLVDDAQASLIEEWFADLSAGLLASAGRRPVARWLEAARAIRALVPTFLEERCRAILAVRPKVVGFTSSLDQLVPSLALAKLLKLRDPGIRVVLGGAECRSRIGLAIHQAFPFLDAVVRGDGELLAPPLFRDLVAGRAPTPAPGLSVLVAGQIVGDDTADGQVGMSQVPLPDYDEYFAQLNASSLATTIAPVLLYQMSRGCWWGEHSRCFFCSRDESAIPFRRVTPARMADDLRALATRHHVTRLELVDDNIEPDTVSEALTQLRQEGLPLTITWCQSHPSLDREQLRRLRAAGVTTLFVGIESLSSAVLKLVRKGTTTLSSVRFLRWCAEVGLNVRWNLLYGLPGETPADYQRMAELMRSLTHLAPPYYPVRIDLRRFSPYFDAPDRYGIEILAPTARHRYFAALVAADASELALSFEFRVRGQEDPSTYAASSIEAYRTWLVARARGSTLRSYATAGEVRVEDRRTDRVGTTYVLAGIEAEVYRGCDHGATAREVLAALTPRASAPPSRAEVERLLAGLVARRLVLEDGGRYLALAIPSSGS